MKVHHIGYAVKDMDLAIHSFEALGFTVGTPIIDTSRNVRIAFAENGAIKVELVAPYIYNSDIDGILKRSGASPYHICYEVDDMGRSIRELHRDGWVLVKPPAEAPAINGHQVAFLFSKNAGLIELVEIK